MSYSTTTAFSGPNTFLRLDYHLNANNQASFRWTREAIVTQRDTHRGRQGDPRRRPPRERCGRPGVQLLAGVGAEQPHDQRGEARPRAREPAPGRPAAVRRQLEVHRLPRRWSRSMSARRTRTPTTSPGRRNTYAQDLIRDITFDDTLTWIAGRAQPESRRRLEPQRRAAAGNGRELHRAVHVPGRRAVQRRRTR